MKPVFRSLALLLPLMSCLALAQQEPAEDAIRRVAESHDPAIFVAIGALFVKQEAIRAAGGRALPSSAEAEVNQLIDAEIRDPAWFRTAIAKSIRGRLSAEEADEVATHFATQPGRLQRQVVELSLGEVLTSTYTFTGKIDYQLAATATEMAELQRAVGPMRGTCNCPTPKEREEMQRVAAADRPANPMQDLSVYPEAVKFGTSGTGVKYVKILMMQGIEEMNLHFAAVAKQARGIAAPRK
jgi:hypothetical protein